MSLCINFAYYKQKLLPSRLRVAPIYGYKHKYLEDSLSKQQ